MTRELEENDSVYRIAIVDDSTRDAGQLEELIEGYFAKSANRRYMVRLYQNSSALLWDLDDRKQFDIYFLDVEMPEQTSGLELAYKIRTYCLEAVIIYVTNYVKYAPQAFEVNAFRYIPKQMLGEKLGEALDCILPKIDRQDQRTYVIEVQGRLERILYKNIVFIGKDGKYITIHHRDGESRERKSLSQIMDALKAPEFVYIDKGYIVNIQHIESLQKDCILLKNGMELKISRSKYRDVKEKAADYWRGLR